MKAIAKVAPEKGVELVEKPMPEMGINDVLIKIKKTAICGTDVHIYEWNSWAQEEIKPPLTIGHEYVGEVVEVGSNVKSVKVGERVSGEGHIVCGHCRNCRAGQRHLCRETKGVGVNRDGAFAEYLCIPESNVWHCDPSIDDELYSIFDPFGNATHTALSFNMVGEDVLITGAGPIGIMAAGISKFVGARNVVVVDVNDYRLGLAKRLGATRTVNAKDEKLEDVMKELGMVEGFDVGLEMSGAAPCLHEGQLEPHRLEGAQDKGHLRARDVRDLVQDGRDDTGRLRYLARHHAPLQVHRLREGLRGDDLGQVRQGYPRLGMKVFRGGCAADPFLI